MYEMQNGLKERGEIVAQQSNCKTADGLIVAVNKLGQVMQSLRTLTEGL